MHITAFNLCQLLNGTLEGNPDVEVDTVAKIEEGHSRALSFLANPKYEAHIYDTRSGIVLVNRTFRATKPIKATLIRVDDPYASFTAILTQYAAQVHRRSGIETPSFIGEGSETGTDLYLGAFAYIGKYCKIGNNVIIYPHCFIGDNAEIGDNTILHAGVTIYHQCKVGSDCIIHAGAVIGSDGFGFAPKPDGSYAKIPQIGNVIIEDQVEIGANTAIDRATMGSTIIRKGAKLDNLIQIAHNVEIGANTVIAGQSAIAGSTKVGEQNVLGGQVGLAGHIVTAKGTQIGAQSGILSSIKEEGKKWMGSPATEFKEHFKSQVVFRNLPEMDKNLHELRKEMEHLRKLIEEKESS
jgi:UDP-3-O-[3-hydroxymyristoyl] glucosamine N-acyltransferase